MANEKRLIDANALLKWLEECTDEKDWIVSQYNADWIWSMLDSAPTVDAVEVVRCKDCKNWKKGNFKGGDTKENLEWGGSCHLSRFARYESDFCSFGERREGE